MIYIPYNTNQLAPFKNWQNRFLLDKTLQHHQLQQLQKFDDQFFCFENTWLSQQAQKNLHEGYTICVDNTIIAAPYNFLKEQKKKLFYHCNYSFIIAYPWHLIALHEQVIEMQLKANEIIGEISVAANIDGIIHLGEGSRILPGVYIEGKVSIGDNCKIGPNCYIRGATSIGDNCHIGQSVEIKNCYIMNNTNIGHLSYVGDSILGSKVNFGAGTTVANLRHDNQNHQIKINDILIDTKRRKLGVIIGDEVHTGINTSFYPACIMQENMTTKPAEVIIQGKNSL